MRNCYRQTAFLWIAALAMPLVWPAVAAYAQVESLADWAAKEYAKPLQTQRVTFPGLSNAMRTGQWQDPTNDPPQFTDYFQKQIFPWITYSDKRGEKQDVVAKLRSDFKTLSKFSNSPVADTLADITLEYMTPIIKDPKWHPAVRENALLAIGEVRDPKTVAVLLQIIQDKNLHPMFKVVAMTDLAHLAEQGVVAASPAANSVVTLMAAAAGRSTPNPTDSLRWMRGQAADVLGALRSTGPSGEVPPALLSMVADEKLPLIVRGKAARALGKLNYGGTLPDAATYTKNFAEFGSAALDKNLPGEARRIWAVCDDFLGGLQPLIDSGSPPQAARDMYNAMDALKKAASKQKPSGKYPSEDDLKLDAGKARKVLDAAAGKK